MSPDVAAADHPAEADLRGLLQGDLPDDRAGAVARHLDGCPECRDVAERLTGPPRELWADLMVASADRRDSWSAEVPSIPGYEGLVELGRGGCGVVYRAVESTTGREVALKVLRAGGLASAAEQRRFLAEARAAARLRHPNLVTVLAVGEAYGLPYYAMEHLPAGSLASRLEGTPLTPERAAALVASIAGAIQHAHEAGVIHRDIKPGNILLDGLADRLELGTPKVSDFGMAKHADAALTATPTQAVLGTPSYMAPEQAFGRGLDVGPAADIYGLGAILYEVLTGRPPFRGATPYETLLQLRDDEPAPPRRLRPSIPRDLETICLKCLEKDPRRRYPTAAGFADDLRAFQAGRAVAARPVGWPGRASRWARREPVIASLTGLSLSLLIAGLLGTTLLWRRAEARGAMARQALAISTQSITKLFRNPGLITREERDGLVRALELYEQLLGELSGFPEEERKAAYATLQLAEGLGNIHEYDAAVRVCRRAVAILGRLSADYPDRHRYRFSYAEGCSQLGNTLAVAGRRDEALDFRRRAVQIGEHLVGLYPESDEYRGGLGAFQANLSADYLRRGELIDAEHFARRSLETSRELVAAYPQDPVRYQFFAAASRGLAEVLIRKKDTAGYLLLMIERLELCVRARRDQPNWPQIAPHLIDHELVIAMELSNRDLDAGRIVEFALETWGQRAAAEPADADARILYASWLDTDGRRLWPSDTARASDQFRRAVDVLTPIAEGAGGSNAAAELATLLAMCPDPAIRDPARAVKLARQAKTPMDRHSHASGVALYESGDYGAACSELEGFLSATRPVPDAEQVRIARLYLAMSYYRTGQRDRAGVEIRALAASIRSDPRWSWRARSTLLRAQELLAG